MVTDAPTSTAANSAAVALEESDAGLLALTWGPLRERFRRGEGALLAINATWLAFVWPGAEQAAVFMGYSAVGLMAAYAFNDWHDAHGDVADPKKNQQLVRGFIARHRSFGRWLLALHVALVCGAAWMLGAAPAMALAALLGVNTLYSTRLKGVPVIDLLIVGVWGAAFAAIVLPPLWLIAAVGLMTSIMHLFQIEQDRHVDRANEIGTTVVRMPGAALWMLIAICAGLAGTLYAQLGAIGALSALTPLALYRFVHETEKAWMACRIYCGVVLLLALGRFHGLG